jgi:hypothetical protein
MTTPSPWDPTGQQQPAWDPGANPPGPGYPAQVPGGPWHVPAYLNPEDPLVPPPYSGFDGWFKRLTGTTRRSWRPVLVVLALTHVLPAMTVGVLAVAYFGLFTPFFSLLQTQEPLDGSEVGPFVAGILVFVLVGIVVVSLGQALGYAGSTWILTREAVGQPAPIGDALRYGLRRMVGLWGWTLLFGLIIGLGFCLCVLPGLYFGLALALFGPVYMFERGNPFGRAWRMFHDNFGPVLGRVALLAAALFAVQMVVSLIQNVVLTAVGGPQAPAELTMTLSLVFTLFGYLIQLPATMIQTIGVVVTYAEQRARLAPLNSATLAAELAPIA